jgi:hypothetical protein
MADRFGDIMGGFLQRGTLRHWTRMADRSADLSPAALRQTSQQARVLRRLLNGVIHEADARLTGPGINRDTIDTPRQCDWAWRPDAWRGPIVPPAYAGITSGTQLGTGLKLFHDCPLGEISVRQIRSADALAQAPYGVVLDIFGFEGSFLSLVFDLPEAGRATTRNHILRITGALEMEREIESFARLNLKHGPNTEQLVSELVVQDGRFMAEFDLGHADVNEKRLENIWLDIIFDRPAMNRVVMGDLTLMRRPRADL